MLVRLNEYTEEEKAAEVEAFTVTLPNGTQFRITQDTYNMAVVILRIGSGKSSMMPLTVTPLSSNKIILS